MVATFKERAESGDIPWWLVLIEGIALLILGLLLLANPGMTTIILVQVIGIFWFIDGKLLGVVKPGERCFYTPEVGRHRLVCQDNLGRCAEVSLIIEKADYD